MNVGGVQRKPDEKYLPTTGAGASCRPALEEARDVFIYAEADNVQQLIKGISIKWA